MQKEVFTRATHHMPESGYNVTLPLFISYPSYNISQQNMSQSSKNKLDSQVKMAPAKTLELCSVSVEAFKLLEQKLEQEKKKKSREQVINCVQAAEVYGGWLITEHYAKQPPLRKA